MPVACSLVINLTQVEFYFSWNRTLVTCPIPVLLWNLGNNWRSDKRQISQASLSGRTSMRDQPRNKNKIKKRRRHRSSSTSSSSRSASSDSRRTQAVQNPDILQPEEVTNVQTITPEQTLLHPSKDSGSESEMETWSFDRAIYQ